jgi:hypothetical protein
MSDSIYISIWSGNSLAVVWRGAHWLERVCVTVEKKTGAGRIAVKTHSLEKDRQSMEVHVRILVLEVILRYAASWYTTT